MKVIILCGGVGSRLAEETKLIPKPMVKIDQFQLFNTSLIFINLIILKNSYLLPDIKKKLLKITLKIKISNVFLLEKNTLTGGRLLRLKKYFSKDENFLLTYGDGLSNQNLKNLVNFHLKNKKIATLTAVKPPARFGELKIKGNFVNDFKEKPQLQNNWINGGFFVFNSKIFKFIKGDSEMLEREPFQKLAKKKQLLAFKHNGFWQCMDTMRDKLHLQKIWRQKGFGLKTI